MASILRLSRPMTSMIRRALSRVTRSHEPTYEAARAELGGVPWREVPKSTDAWYILDEDVAPLTAPESRRTRVAVVGLAVVLAAALLFFLTRSRASDVAPLPAAVVTAAVAPPTVTVTPSAPERPAPQATPIRHAARAAHHVATKPAGKKHAHR